MSAPSLPARLMVRRATPALLAAALSLLPAAAARAATAGASDVSAVTGLTCIHVDPWVCTAPVGAFTFQVSLTAAGVSAVASGMSYFAEDGLQISMELGANPADAAAGQPIPITINAAHSGLLELALGSPAQVTIYVGAGTLPPWPGTPDLTPPKANRPQPVVLAEPGAAYALKEQKTFMQAIIQAHASEGVRAWRLPSNFWQLRAIDQLFVLTNLERTSRGLWPLWGVVPTLNRMALTGAEEARDPTYVGATNTPWGSNWYSGTNPEAAVFGWMYEDGPGLYGENVDCPSAGATGCYGHRDNVLGNWGPYGLFGAGVSSKGGTADLMVSGAVPVTTGVQYTWADAVKMGARPAN